MQGPPEDWGPRAYIGTQRFASAEAPRCPSAAAAGAARGGRRGRRGRIGEVLGVRSHAIELPARALRIGRPDLVLPRVAAGPIDFDLAGDARGLQAGDRLVDLGGVVELHAQMVQAL